MMKRMAIWGLGLCICAGLGVNGVAARAVTQAMPATQAVDKTPPSYDMKPQAILDLQDMQKKFTQLAEAIPADKYNWRPNPEIRSVAELFLHVASANYGIPNMIGVATPAGFDGKTYEKSTTDKAKIIAELNKSFVSAIAGVQSMSNADFAKPEKKLGPDANDGDIVYLLVVHAHEQLGHAIVYARSNGIVPPWTAEALKKKP
jgi:DinB superfamily